MLVGAGLGSGVAFDGVRRPGDVKPESESRAVGAAPGKTGIAMGGEVIVPRNDEIKGNIPRISCIGGIGKQVLQGRPNFRSNGMSLFRGPKKLSFVTGQDGMESVGHRCGQLQ